MAGNPPEADSVRSPVPPRPTAHVGRGNARFAAATAGALKPLVLLTIAAIVIAGLAVNLARDREPTTIGALKLELPSHWNVRQVTKRCGRAGPGLLVGNLTIGALRRLRHDLTGLPAGACTTEWNVRQLPPTYLLVDITRLRIPAGFASSTFPLRYAGLSRSALPCRCVFRSGYVVTSGLTYALRVWVGRGAGAVERRTLRALIASIRPRRG